MADSTLPPVESGITPEDVARAKARWLVVAPPAFKALLDAEVRDAQEG